MARPRTQQKDILSRVTDLGAEALNKLTDIPGGSKVLELANESKTRLDEMQKKLRGLDALEKRVAKLERELAKSKPAARKAATARKRTTTARKPASKPKPPA
jgi:hypothetical protein